MKAKNKKWTRNDFLEAIKNPFKNATFDNVPDKYKNIKVDLGTGKIIRDEKAN